LPNVGQKYCQTLDKGIAKRWTKVLPTLDKSIVNVGQKYYQTLDKSIIKRWIKVLSDVG